MSITDSNESEGVGLWTPKRENKSYRTRPAPLAELAEGPTNSPHMLTVMDLTSATGWRRNRLGLRIH